MAIPPTINTLQDVIDAVNQVYVPSRAIPPKTKEKLTQELFRIFDFIHFKDSTEAMFRLQDLTDVFSAPRDALIAMILEFDLPVPEFITTPQMRELACNTGTINKFRNTVQGWEQYLDIIAPVGATADVSIRRFTGRVFLYDFPGRGYANFDIMLTRQSDNDLVAYLFNTTMLEIEIIVTIRGSGLTQAFKNFVLTTPRFFVPTFIDSELVEIRFIFEEF